MKDLSKVLLPKTQYQFSENFCLAHAYADATSFHWVGALGLPQRGSLDVNSRGMTDIMDKTSSGSAELPLQNFFGTMGTAIGQDVYIGSWHQKWLFKNPTLITHKLKIYQIWLQDDLYRSENTQGDTNQLVEHLWKGMLEGMENVAYAPPEVGNEALGNAAATMDSFPANSLIFHTYDRYFSFYNSQHFKKQFKIHETKECILQPGQQVEYKMRVKQRPYSTQELFQKQTAYSDSTDYLEQIGFAKGMTKILLLKIDTELGNSAATGLGTSTATQVGNIMVETNMRARVWPQFINSAKPQTIRDDSRSHTAAPYGATGMTIDLGST